MNAGKRKHAHKPPNTYLCTTEEKVELTVADKVPTGQQEAIDTAGDLRKTAIADRVEHAAGQVLLLYSQDINVAIDDVMKPLRCRCAID